MHVAPFSRATDSLLQRCDEAGVVVDFIRLVLDSAAEDGESAHGQAAIAGVAEALRRSARGIEALSPDEHVSEDMKRDIARHWSDAAASAARHEAADLAGERITPAQFFAPEHTLVVKRRWLRRRTWWVRHWPDYDVLGFARAFYDPPHGLGVGQDPAAEIALFESVVREVLAAPGDGTEIYSWSTDWSIYFEDGLEWWGAACWTVRTSPSEIVVVLASTTD